MIIYDKIDLIDIVKNRRNDKLFLLKNLFFEIKHEDFDDKLRIKINLTYKNEKISTDSFFFDKNESLNNILNCIINSKIFFLRIFCKDINNFKNDKESVFLEKIVDFIINKKILNSKNDFLIFSFDDITLISIEFENKNRQIFLVSVKDGKLYYRFVKIANELNEKYSVYNPYEFILKNNLFEDTIFYNELATELSYKLSGY